MKDVEKPDAEDNRHKGLSTTKHCSRVPLWLFSVLLVLGGAGLALIIALPLTLVKDRDRTSIASRVNDIPVKEPGVVRRYYIRAEQADWDYAPSGLDLCLRGGGAVTNESSLYISQACGSKFPKAVFREYMDAAFKDPKPISDRDVHLGMSGPRLVAEVGDTIEIVLKNTLPFGVNVEPSGVLYTRPATAYPNETLTYRWSVGEEAAPNTGGPSSKLWLYRSSVDVVGHTTAGLYGPLVVVQKGQLGNDGRPKDVDREFFLMWQVFNEALSPLFVSNSTIDEGTAPEDLDESLLKHAVNGRIFCNLVGLTAKIGERVRWYVASLGSEEIHTAHWHGIVLVTSGRRHVDEVMLLPGSVITLDSIMDNPGTWLLHCHVNDHLRAGMTALFTIEGEARPAPLSGTVRQYFLAAEEVVWDYAPLGGEMCTGQLTPFRPNALGFVNQSSTRIGTKYLKGKFVEYTDATFSIIKPRSPEWQHLGLLGPVLRADVGDEIVVTLMNRLPHHEVSIHPHGVMYDKMSEGSPYNDGTTGEATADDAVPTNKTQTYRWKVLERSGPGENDMSSKMWMYHSHTNEITDTYAGLAGPIIITRKGQSLPDGRPKDVDREVILSFTVMDENESFMLEDNLERFLPEVARMNGTAREEVMADPDFVESNLMHGINGYIYCNLPDLQLTQGEKVRMYFMALGSNVDMHTPVTQENPIYMEGHQQQSIAIVPGTMLTTMVTPNVAGFGIIECAVADHVSAGMSAIYEVKAANLSVAAFTGSIRTYYLAADEVMWDYTPQGRDVCKEREFSEEQQVFVVTTNETMGSQYKKAVYRRYSDDTFTTLVDPPHPMYGIVGPTLHAEVGDKLIVFLKNNLPFKVGIQMYGGLVQVEDKQQTQTQGRKHRRHLMAAEAEAEAEVHDVVNNLYANVGTDPGAIKKYEWMVPESSGPSPLDGPSVAYAYLSGVDNIGHTNTGLMGVVVISEANTSRDGGHLPKGVDYEFPLIFNIQKEFQNVYMQENVWIQQNLTGLVINQTSPSYLESNVMHSMNGYLWCNMPAIVVPINSTVRWIVVALGSETDMHAPVFSGQSISRTSQRIFSPILMPANVMMVEMRATQQGTWEIFCMTLDHYSAGMISRLIVS